jgi:hypothetical protein
LTFEDLVHNASARQSGESHSDAASLETNDIVKSEAATVLTFAQLKDLIEKGKTDEIPNNRHIPLVINVCPLVTALCIISQNNT